MPKLWSSAHNAKRHGRRGGGSPTFHTREDTPEVTGPELLEPIARLLKSDVQGAIAGVKE